MSATRFGLWGAGHLVLLATLVGCGDGEVVVTACRPGTLATTGGCVEVCDDQSSSADCHRLTSKSCTGPDGASIADGAAVTYYENESVRHGSTCDGEVRMCVGGSLSGSYPFADCYVRPPELQGRVLWTRSDLGVAALWTVAAGTAVSPLPMTASAFVNNNTGVGAAWQATSYEEVDEHTAYVLWTRSDTGRAALWKIDPASGDDPIRVIASADLGAATGIGANWQATSYHHGNATTGYVLWSRRDTGQAALWKVDPSKMTGVMTATASSVLHNTAGVGAGWLATSYEHVNDTTAYVLWSKVDTGVGILWKVNPTNLASSTTIALVSYAYLSAATGVGALWQARDYQHVDDTHAYVLWSRGDNGQAVLWEVNPSVAATIPIVSSAFVQSAAGIGGPWLATSYRVGY
ncbi:MAG: hypothetical protein HY903_17610 [Deltaproteobacteria bacterium]|nr:hypothetical protein [Deltaproteobacteria bacterium]